MLAPVERQRVRAVPELFLGMLSIGIAFVLVAHVAAGTIHDVRHRNDTITVTGSAHRPITSNLVRWSVGVSSTDASAALAARRLDEEFVAVRKFLIGAAVPTATISASVVASEEIVERIPRGRKLPPKLKRSYRVSQTLRIETSQIDVVERVAPKLGTLIGRGITVQPDPLEYLSTELAEEKFKALAAATADAHRRAEILVDGLGGKLGAMRRSDVGVFQITPRNSTEVSDYGISDTSTRDKDVTAVVTATFNVNH
jgi:hypothetical protein